MDQQRQERLAPQAQLLVQERVNQEHIRLLRLILIVIRRHELAHKLDNANAPPRAAIHCRDRRQRVTHHEELAHDDEFLLVAKQRSRLHHVLTRELLHPRGIDRLLVIRLLEIDEAPALSGHDIRIGRTRLRALSRQHRALERGLVVAQRHPHQLHQLGLSVATHARRHVEALLAIHPLQTRGQETEGVAPKFRIGEQLTEEVHDVRL